MSKDKSHLPSLGNNLSPKSSSAKEINKTNGTLIPQSLASSPKRSPRNIRQNRSNTNIPESIPNLPKETENALMDDVDSFTNILQSDISQDKQQFHKIYLDFKKSKSLIEQSIHEFKVFFEANDNFTEKEI